MVQKFDVPEHSWLLSVITQNNIAQMYFIVDLEQPLKERHFVMYGTGNDIDCNNLDELLFIGTVKSDDEAFVGHVFEIDPRE